MLYEVNARKKGNEALGVYDRTGALQGYSGCCMIKCGIRALRGSLLSLLHLAHLRRMHLLLLCQQIPG